MNSGIAPGLTDTRGGVKIRTAAVYLWNVYNNTSTWNVVKLVVGVARYDKIVRAVFCFLFHGIWSPVIVIGMAARLTDEN